VLTYINTKTNKNTLTLSQFQKYFSQNHTQITHLSKSSILYLFPVLTTVENTIKVTRMHKLLNCFLQVQNFSFIPQTEVQRDVGVQNRFPQTKSYLSKRRVNLGNF